MAAHKIKLFALVAVLVLSAGAARAAHQDNHLSCMGEIATIKGTPVDDVLTGTPGHDVIAGVSGDDAIFGLGGDDYICGGEGDDQIEAAIGDDFTFGGAGHDQVLAGSGDDYAYGGPGDDVVLGQDGIDLVRGGPEYEETRDDADHVGGGSGPDLLLDGYGTARFDGGEGSDTLAYGSSVALVDLVAGIALSEDDSVDSLARVENVSAYIDRVGTGRSRGADPVVRGNHADNILIGTSGTDHLLGGDGDDIVDGLCGTDHLEGGSGVDIASFRFIYDVEADLGTGRAHSDSSCALAPPVVPSVFFSEIEGLAGGWGADHLTGDGSANFLYGYYGNDHLYGQAGDDLLDGLEGNDWLNGGMNRDRCLNGEILESCEGSSAETAWSGQREALEQYDLIVQLLSKAERIETER